MDASDLNSRRDDDDDDSEDDRDTNVNGWGSPKNVKDCNAQRDPSLAENVGVLTLLSTRSSTRNCYIQHPSVSSGNISKPLASVSDLTSSSPCKLLP
jgi:hypothetical protein